MHIEKLIARAQELSVVYGARILLALAILIVGFWVAKMISRLSRKGMTKAKVDPTLASFLTNVIYIALAAFVILATLSQLGIQTASFIAVLGAAGLAVGLALQGSLSNLASGVLIILFKPFRLGDTIKVAGVEGKVAAIQVFTTVLLTEERKKIIVPNAKITSDIIVNSTADVEEFETVK